MKLFATFVLSLTVAAVALAGEFKGTIADSHCATSKGAEAASPDHAKCAESCIKKGAAAVLVTPEGKVYKLDDQKQATPLAGKKVTVDGKLEGDTIKIDKIAAE